MNKYTGYKCAACAKAFEDSDDVVVCPVCGAPHHRSCYINAGGCAASALHADGKAYEPVLDVKVNEEETEKTNIKTCPVCGRRYSGDYCPGNHENASQRDFRNGEGNFQNGFQFITPEQFRYGGINPDEKIEDSTVRELSDYVGPSGGNFIRKWYVMFKNRNSISVNFAALFFGPYYYLYRKMWLWGIIYLAFSLVAAVPSYFVLISSYMNKAIDTALWTNMSQVFSFISFAVKIIASLLFNKIYLLKAQNGIKNGKPGGVSKFAVLVSLGITMLFSELFMLLL